MAVVIAMTQNTMMRISTDANLWSLIADTKAFLSSLFFAVKYFN
jgi:hypothetical protein